MVAGSPPTSGRPSRLSTLLSETPHGLNDQSRNARQMADSTVAGDGWGVGWFSPRPGPKPGMIKSILPLWSDENAKTATHAIVSGSVVGHIRFASPKIEVCFINTPLYVLGEHLWTINGELKPWPGPLSKAIRDRLDPEDEAAIRGSTDAEILGALWRTPSAAPAPATRPRRCGEAGDARDLAFEHGGEIKMNVIVADASGFLAVRYAEPGEPNSLYYLRRGPLARGCRWWRPSRWTTAPAGRRSGPRRSCWPTGTACGRSRSVSGRRSTAPAAVSRPDGRTPHDRRPTSARPSTAARGVVARPPPRAGRRGPPALRIDGRRRRFTLGPRIAPDVARGRNGRRDGGRGLGISSNHRDPRRTEEGRRGRRPHPRGGRDGAGGLVALPRDRRRGLRGRPGGSTTGRSGP